MHLTSFLALPLTLVTTLTTAIPVHPDSSNPALTWHVTNFRTGCSPGGCVYDFNILGIQTPNTPGFNTTCSGNDRQDGYKVCKDRHVRAQLNSMTYPKWNVQVKHVWSQGEADFIALGEANVTEPAKKFPIQVTEEYGVA